MTDRPASQGKPKPPASPRPGARNAITDIPGLRVGHAQDARWQTGSTVLLCDRPMVASVDVRGGAPGTRETEALDPANLVGAVDALVLSGGSAFGLAACDGVIRTLAEQGRGLLLGQARIGVPIVAGAILFDLAYSGMTSEAMADYAALGRQALLAAGQDVAMGSVGAGRGAMAGTIKGGIGTASLDLGGGLMVGALVAANPVGSVLMPGSDCFWAWPFEIDGEFGGIRPDPASPPAIAPVPQDSKLAALQEGAQAGLNTAIAIVATSAALDQAQTKRLAMMAQDGFARAIRPAHTPFDGDTVFALASGDIALPGNRPLALAEIGSAAADTLARATARAVYEARQPSR
ncbi:MAG: P1 family peptidase [Neomegalonema sp.]|nr:P1 family peptidase [Neomegalonema sp.]